MDRNLGLRRQTIWAASTVHASAAWMDATAKSALDRQIIDTRAEWLNQVNYQH